MYHIILIISIILTLISYFLEQYFPFINNYNIINKEYINIEKIKSETNKNIKHNNIHIYILKFIHFIIFIYTSCYILFFSCNNNIDVYLYLTVTLLIVLHWNYFGYCILSYLELKNYNINIKNYTTTFHPTIFCIFRKYSDSFVEICGALMILNIIIILIANVHIKLKYKIIYALVYFSLFYKTVSTSRKCQNFYIN